MKRNIYKIKNFVVDDEDRDKNEGINYIDMYLDVNTITGFLMPIVEEEGAPKLINIFNTGEFVTAISEPHIEKYLYENFVIPAKVNNE